MKTLPRVAVAFATAGLAGLLFAEMHGSAIATPSAGRAAPQALQATIAQSTAPTAAPPLVNLPDFSRLVEKAGPAVVNIEATIGSGRAGARAQPGDDDGSDEGDDGLPGQDASPEELFKRFFGQPGQPGMPSPQVPRNGTSFGSGFIISPDGYVLTNHHVVDGASEVIVHLTDRRELKARVVGSDPQSDIAVLKVDAANLPSMTLSDSRNLKPGQWVLAIGSPFGFDHSVTAGIVSGLGRPSLDSSQRYVPYNQTDVAINRGNSGGPLLNTSGEVVGINSQIFSNSGGYMGVSFAIPIEVAMNAVRQIQKTGHVSRGSLGVTVGDVQREQMAELGLTRAGGAFISGVQNGSAAEKAGIKPGDVIVAFNGKEIVSSSELPPLVGAMPPGSRATVKLLRDGKPLDVVVVLNPLVEGTAATQGGTSPRAGATGGADLNKIGVVVGDLDATARARMGLSPGEGVRISRVASLAARQAGLAAGDVILQVGKQPVGSTAQFESALRGVKSGDRVRLLVRNAESTGLVTVPAS
jgi:serine protease Do